MSQSEHLKTTREVEIKLLHPEDFQEALVRAAENDIMLAANPEVPVTVDGHGYLATVFPTTSAHLGQLCMPINEVEGDYTHYFVLAVNDAGSNRGWYIPEGSVVVIVKGDDDDVIDVFFRMAEEEQLMLQGH